MILIQPRRLNTLHGEKGRIEVSLKWKNHSFAEISVADQGMGISASDLPHIFNKFKRLDSDPKVTAQEGTGLGLYITKNLVELLGGKIQAKSVLGKGSTFSFTIPLA